MTLEQRVRRTEREVTVLKREIRETLQEMREILCRNAPSPSKWRKRAWVLALLNTLLAIELFTNIRLYHAPTTWAGPNLVGWMRAFWVASAFVWLLLQLYPVALLLDQDEKRSREAAWRSGARILTSNPGLTLALTLLVLAVAVVGVLFPSLWFIAVAALLAVACINAVVHS